MLRMRKIQDAYEEIKAVDPNTAITRNYIRRLIISGTVPSIMAGRKHLVNMDALEAYLSNPKPINNPIEFGRIRPVKEHGVNQWRKEE
ncbi:MAG: hypothetical protein CVU86_06400 [Firmicutes bacterium HGW-Firmicutes-11]|jgi:excisionase family DNA binding protein|nr:MAG: hypothetical protein CVU86_06400 [Firmicutes bacterium HGW-Firmicutes-11]